MTVHIKQDLITILACFWCESLPDNSKNKTTRTQTCRTKTRTAATDIYSALGQKLKKQMQKLIYLLIYFASSSVATPCTSVL